MAKFTIYNIYLKELTEHSEAFEFELGEEFFKKIDSPEAERGNVKARVEACRKGQSFELKISLAGYVTLPCARCLDDMQQPIEHSETLRVKLGKDFGEEADTVIVPEADGYINLAWFFYEMIVVNIPIKHVHPAGECNKTMQQKLRKHSVGTLDDDYSDEDNNFDADLLTDTDPDSNDREPDPRWDKLKSVITE
ncbi:MAG: DUF177 domain-containing protein [Prevotellaceae bacterium]|jgi:uncharacterized metal-binding protein YceD (DUF177 family)|nr:DUF177 domain-containing protein [Prevotellaceae bacterium]